jgi:transposase
MMMVGIDVHKCTHTAVAVSETGVRLGQLTVPADLGGYARLIRWVAGLSAEVGDCELGWAVEDCRSYSRGVEAALLVAGFTVFRVPPHVSAGTRKSGRVRGKSDPVDALAVARAALREPDLPVAVHDPARRAIKIVADDRDRLVVERTAGINQLRAGLHELALGLEPGGRGISATTLRRLREQLAGAARKRELGPDQVAGIAVARRITARLIELTTQIAAATKELDELSQALAPELRAISGCSVVTSAWIIAETGDVARFRSADAFAM